MCDPVLTNVIVGCSKFCALLGLTLFFLTLSKQTCVLICRGRRGGGGALETDCGKLVTMSGGLR